MIIWTNVFCHCTNWLSAVGHCLSVESIVCLCLYFHIVTQELLLLNVTILITHVASTEQRNAASVQPECLGVKNVKDRYV